MNSDYERERQGHPENYCQHKHLTIEEGPPRVAVCIGCGETWDADETPYDPEPYEGREYEELLG